MLHLSQENESLNNRTTGSKSVKISLYFVSNVNLQTIKYGQKSTKTRFLPSCNKNLTRILQERKLKDWQHFYLDIQILQKFQANFMYDMSYLKTNKNCCNCPTALLLQLEPGLNLLINPLISRCKNLEMLCNSLHQNI